MDPLTPERVADIHLIADLRLALRTAQIQLQYAVEMGGQFRGDELSSLWTRRAAELERLMSVLRATILELEEHIDLPSLGE